MKQMQLTYLPLEDRLLFRLNTLDDEELRFWMTRRYVLVLWPLLMPWLLPGRHGREEPETPAVPVSGPPGGSALPDPDPLLGAVLARDKHDEAIAGADFDTPYQPSHTLPLGEAPVLLSRVVVKEGVPGQIILSLHPEEGNGIDWVLDEPMLHSFCHLLMQVVRHSGWGFDLSFQPPNQGGAGSAEWN